MLIRTLHDQGISEFEARLQRLRSGEDVSFRDMIENDGISTSIPDAISIDPERDFPSKYDAAEYLSNLLGALDREYLDTARGLWAWLSVLYFDKLVGPKRKIRDNARYIPSLVHWREYRHLLKGPYKAFRLHGEAARVLLAGPLHIWSDLEEQIAGIQEIFRMPGAMQAAYTLYYDPKKGSTKRNSSNRNKPGNVRRLGAVVQQLDLTYDLYSMNGTEIVELLPAEFDTFRTK